MVSLTVAVLALSRDWSSIVSKVNSDPTSTWRAKMPSDGDASRAADLHGYKPLAAHDPRPPFKMDGYGLAKSDLPTDYDARKVHPECTSIGTIRDQCGCGSCFAFGAIEAFEDRICIHLHKNVTLSVEDIISCHEDENMSCQGGNPIAVWQNIFAGRKEGDGAVQDSCYPYSIPTCPCNHHSSVSSLPACPPEGAISTPTCDFSKKFSCEDEGIYRAQSATLIPAANMEQELVEQGPITVAYTVYDDFLTYKSGVYSKTAGAKALGGHSVKIVGYGVDATSGLKYWTVANSWVPRMSFQPAPHTRWNLH
jgi:cathepsin B